MNVRIRKSQAARGVFALLLLCTLAIRVLIPDGFMPVRGAQGIVISLCTAEGAVRTVVPAGQDEDHPDRHDGPEAPCAFAAGPGGGLLDSPPSPAFRVPAPRSADPSPRRIADLTVHRLAAPPPPAQGPPLPA